MSGSTPSQWPSRVGAEVVKKPIELTALSLATGATGALAAMALALNRYLAVFNQAGLLAPADGFSPALLRALGFMFVAILLLTSMLVIAPVFSRLAMASQTNNPLAAAFDWPDKVDTPRWRNFGVYLVAHGPLVTLLAYYALASLFPEALNNQTGISVAFSLGLIPPLVFVALSPAETRKWSRAFVALLTAAQLGLFALSWFLVVMVLFGAPGVATGGHASLAAAGQLAISMILVLFAHWVLTVISTNIWACLTIGLAIVLAVMIGAPGDLAITFNVLRLAGVGGGVPKAYRDPAAGPDAAPKTACLILPAGDLQVILLAPDPASCDPGSMHALYKKLRSEGAQARADDLRYMRVVRRDVFIDTLKPADFALEPPAPAKAAKTKPTPGA